MMFRLAVCVMAACAASFAEEFTVPTPKGNLVVNVTSNNLVLGGSFFDMEGTITNTTRTDFKFLRLKVTFYDRNGNEAASRCPSEPAGLYCEKTVGDVVPARKTVPFDRGVGVALKWDVSEYGRNPDIGSYKLTFVDALNDIRYRFTMLKPAASDELAFDDAVLGLEFAVTPKAIGVNIRNKTTDPVTINWNAVSYVDGSGEAHKIIHSGVRYMDKEAVQPPTVIPPTARIKETIFPTDHIQQTSLPSLPWSEKPLWPDSEKVSKDQSYLKALEGSTFTIFMPIEVGGKTNNYTFVFKIAAVEF